MISHQNKQGNTYVIIDWIYYIINIIIFSKEVIFFRVTKNIELCAAAAHYITTIREQLEPITFGTWEFASVLIYFAKPT
jgi:hypothetical protein